MSTRAGGGHPVRRSVRLILLNEISELLLVANNIEIKARIEITPTLINKVATISDEGPTEIAQDDTFFACANGRLKLRAFPNGTGQLIFYRRSNQRGPKKSFVTSSAVPDIGA